MCYEIFSFSQISRILHRSEKIRSRENKLPPKKKDSKNLLLLLIFLFIIIFFVSKQYFILTFAPGAKKVLIVTLIL